jgi:hypothetical protein
MKKLGALSGMVVRICPDKLVSITARVVNKGKGQGPAPRPAGRLGSRPMQVCERKAEDRVSRARAA